MTANIRSIKRSDLQFVTVLVAYVFFQLYGLENMRTILGDESWYSNPAHNFLKEFKFSNTIVGNGGNANFLYPLSLSISFLLFGVNLFSARLVSVICGVFFLIALRKLFLRINFENKYILLSLIFVVVNPLFNSIFTYARPECLALTLALWAIIYLTVYINTGDHTQIIRISILLYLAVLSHPFAVVFFAVVGLFLLYELISTKDYSVLKYILLLGFIGGASLVTLIISNYYNNINNIADTSVALNGVVSRSSLLHGKYSILQKLESIIDHWILSHRLLISVPLLFILFWGLWSKSKNIILFSVFGIIFFCVGLFVFNNDLGMMSYILYYVFLFSVILFPFFISFVNKKANKLISYVAIIAFLVANLGLSVYRNFGHFDNSNKYLTTELKNILPPNSKVIGPLEFWIFIPETDYKSYFYRYELTEWLSDADYVIVSDVYNYKNYPVFSHLNTHQEVFSFESSQYGRIKVYSLKPNNSILAN